MVLIKSVNLVVRFLLEICALIAISYWGFKTGQGMFFKLLLGVGAPLVAVLIWGMLGSPAAPYRLDVPLRIGLEILINGAATLALITTGKGSLALPFVVVIIVNKILMIVWEQ